MSESGNAPRPGPGGARTERARLSAAAITALAAAAVLLGAGVGWAASRYSSLFHLQATPVHVAALLGAVAAAVLFVRRPAVGLVCLVLVVYLNLSDVLIRFHGFPSVLQLLAPPLLLAAVLEWRRDLAAALSPRSLTVALAAYVLVVLASTTVALDASLADEGVATAAKGFLIFLLVSLLATAPERVRRAGWALVAGGAFLGGLAVIQALAGDSGTVFGGFARLDYGQVYGNVFEARAAGPLGDANFFAQILVLAFPVAVVLAWTERRRWTKALALASAAAIAAGVVATYSRGGALALAVVGALSLFAARPSRRRVALAAGLLAVGLLLLPADFTRRLDTLRQFLPGAERVTELDSSIQNRKLLMQVGWRIFEDHPVMGVGAGNYTVHFGEYAAEVGSTVQEYEDIGRPHYTHNLYLQVASETGLLGLAALGAALLLVLGHLRRAESAYFAAGQEVYAGLASAFQIALVGYLLTALFLHGHFQRYLWLLLGLSAALARAAPLEALAELREEDR